MALFIGLCDKSGQSDYKRALLYVAVFDTCASADLLLRAGSQLDLRVQTKACKPVTMKALLLLLLVIVLPHLEVSWQRSESVMAASCTHWSSYYGEVVSDC